MSDKFLNELEELLEEQKGGAKPVTPEEAVKFLTGKGSQEDAKNYSPAQALAVVKAAASHPDYKGEALVNDRMYSEMVDKLEAGLPYPRWFRSIRAILNSRKYRGSAGKLDIVKEDNLEESFKSLQEAFSAFKVSLNEATAEEKQSYLKMLKELKDG